MNTKMTRWLLAAALAAATVAGCKSEPPRYPTPTTTKPADQKQGASTAQVTPGEQPADPPADPPVEAAEDDPYAAPAEQPPIEAAAPAIVCPGGTVLVGAAPPKGFEQWCAKEPGNAGSPKHGPILHWWDDGSKQFEGTYADGQMDGQWNWYAKTGQTTKSGQFAAGKKHGKWTFWDATGMKVGEATFVGGKMMAQTVFQKDKNGKIKEVRTEMKGFSTRMGGHESAPVGEEGSTGGAAAPEAAPAAEAPAPVVPQVEPPKADAPKAEAPAPVVPQVEPPKADAPKAEAPPTK